MSEATDIQIVFDSRPVKKGECPFDNKGVKEEVANYQDNVGSDLISDSMIWSLTNPVDKLIKGESKLRGVKLNPSKTVEKFTESIIIQTADYLCPIEIRQKTGNSESLTTHIISSSGNEIEIDIPTANWSEWHVIDYAEGHETFKYRIKNKSEIPILSEIRYFREESGFRSKKECYVGYCSTHNWEGHERDKRSEANKDFRGHKELFPDEKHQGGTKKVKCTGLK